MSAPEKGCTCKPGQGYHDRLCPAWTNPYTADEERAYSDECELEPELRELIDEARRFDGE